jgi:hypothetical protein
MRNFAQFRGTSQASVTAISKCGVAHLLQNRHLGGLRAHLGYFRFGCPMFS